MEWYQRLSTTQIRGEVDHYQIWKFFMLVQSENWGCSPFFLILSKGTCTVAGLFSERFSGLKIYQPYRASPQIPGRASTMKAGE
jgi:hypothetical protein